VNASISTSSISMRVPVMRWRPRSVRARPGSAGAVGTTPQSPPAG
jgi:hypothetical protein